MYRNAWWNSKKKAIELRTWDDKGNRVDVSVPYKPYLFIEHPNGQYKSIFNTRLEKHEFQSTYDRKQYAETFGSKRIFGNFDVTQQFLLDCYWNKVGDENFSIRPLRTIFYDIEVDPLPNNEFPLAEEAKAEINIITAWDSIEKKYFIFTKYPYTGKNLIKDAKVLYCENEKKLLLRFLDFWKYNDYPDIISGWNSDGFDFPYIRNRIIKVLGDSFFYMLSPYGNIYQHVVINKMMHEIVKYDIAGITNLDYLDVYAKFKTVKQESYKLDFIAEQEIGYGKVDYNGMTIYEFMSKDWNKFVEYNVRDVELLVKMEEKLRYFQILRLISNMSCVNYDKGLTTIPVTNGALAIRAKQRGEILHTFIRDKQNDKKPGGFVFSNPGLYKDIVTVDATSLYPSIIMSNNISPETKIGVIKWEDDSVDMYKGEPEDKAKITLSNENVYSLTRDKVEYLVKYKDLILSANGCLFSQNKEGIFPSFIKDVFNKRVEVKNQIKRLNKENEKIENRLKELETS